jgi:hypothetical protein
VADFFIRALQDNMADFHEVLRAAGDDFVFEQRSFAGQLILAGGRPGR